MKRRLPAGAAITGALGCMLGQKQQQRVPRRRPSHPIVTGVGGQQNAQPTPRGSLVGANTQSSMSASGSHNRFNLAIDTAARCISKNDPRKNKDVPFDCGEDAFFMTTPHAAIASLGVADGVGSWAEVGIDPSLFAWEVMKGCEAEINAEVAKNIKSDTPAQLDPKAMLSKTFQSSTENGTMPYGSSTACVASLDNATGDLKVANLGDSGVMVLRDGKLVMKSEEQQHSFNCPFQLQCSPYGDRSDSPQAADDYTFKVKEGDLVVMATDGFLDNIHTEEVLEVTALMREKNAEPGDMAETLAKYAHKKSMDLECHTPFGCAAARYGYWYEGGKPDDITVLVGRISRFGKEIGIRL